MTNSIFENINAGRYGGVYFIQNYGAIIKIVPDSKGRQSKFLKFIARDQGSLLYSLAPGLTFFIGNSQVKCVDVYQDYFTLKK